MLKISLLAGAITFALVGLAHAQQAPFQPSPIKRTPLGKVDVPGSNYEVVFGITELAPGPKTGRHSHPGPVLVYVAEGELPISSTANPRKPTRSARRSRYRTARSMLKARTGITLSR